MSLNQIVRSGHQANVVPDADGDDVVPTPESLVRLYESLVGIGSAARACEHLLRNGEPNVAELRTLVRDIIATSNSGIALFRD